jgi:hypothetical protein
MDWILAHVYRRAASITVGTTGLICRRKTGLGWTAFWLHLGRAWDQGIEKVAATCVSFLAAFQGSRCRS